MLKKSLFLFTFLSLLASVSHAQLRSNDLVFGMQAGYKLLGVLGPQSNTIFQETSFKNRPVWHGTLDYALNNRSSLGLAYGIHNTDEVFTSGENANVVVARRSRMDIGVRLLIHYGNENDLDLYSGLRIGYKVDQVYPETASTNSLSIFNSNDRMTFGIVLFGMRYWAAEHLAFTMEINMGRPYIANIGLATRLY